MLTTTEHSVDIVASNTEEENQASGSSKGPICPFCELKEKDLTSLMKHIEQLHKEILAFNCNRQRENTGATQFSSNPLSPVSYTHLRAHET